MLFNAAKGVTVTYTANSDKTDVASTTVGSDGTVTVMAKDMVGMANITITAHGSMPASGVKILDQDDPAEASIMFPVDVMLATLSLTLMGFATLFPVSSLPPTPRGGGGRRFFIFCYWAWTGFTGSGVATATC